MTTYNEDGDDSFQLIGNLVIELTIPVHALTNVTSSSFRIFVSIAPFGARTNLFTYEQGLQQSFEFPLETNAFTSVCLTLVEESTKRELGQWTSQVGRVVQSKWVNQPHKLTLIPRTLEDDSPSECVPVIAFTVRTNWSGNSILFTDFTDSAGSIPPLTVESDDERAMSDSDDETPASSQDVGKRFSIITNTVSTTSDENHEMRVSPTSSTKPYAISVEQRDQSNSMSTDLESNGPELLDRRVPSSADPPTVDAFLAFALIEGNDSYNFQPNRHINTALPALTDGNPILHSSARYGVLYDDTIFFDDRNFLLANPPNPRVTIVRVWSREYIHGIQTVYSYPDSDTVETNRNMGKVHTTMHKLRVDAANGEFIIGMEGTYREWIETLTIITNRRRKTFGGNVENRPSKYVMLPSSKDPSRPLHRFSYMAPHGQKIIGFHGGYGMHIHNLGVWNAPIFDSDQSKRPVWTKIKDKIKRTWSRESLADLTRNTA